MDPIEIRDPDDPRIAAYRNIRERDLTGRQGLFVAEGEVVIRTLLSPASLCAPVSLLLARKRLAAFRDALGTRQPDLPIFVADQPVLDTIAGFPLHRGMLALGRKPEPAGLDILTEGPGDGVILAASGIGNHDNMGGLFRVAAAFGARGLMLDPTCCDPFYRKSIRVSVGAVLRMPHLVMPGPTTMVDALQAADIEVLALTPAATEPLWALSPGGRRAVLVGSEGPGLPREIISRCRPIGIPMSGGFDSLNVAVTAGIVLHQLTRG